MKIGRHDFDFAKKIAIVVLYVGSRLISNFYPVNAFLTLPDPSKREHRKQLLLIAGSLALNSGEPARAREFVAQAGNVHRPRQVKVGHQHVETSFRVIFVCAC